ncbi:hypothetical protein ACTXT7_006276 [Hymenolepis weldensis]
MGYIGEEKKPVTQYKFSAVPLTHADTRLSFTCSSDSLSSLFLVSLLPFRILIVAYAILRVLLFGTTVC